jgi:hypothetical protein
VRQLIGDFALSGGGLVDCGKKVSLQAPEHRTQTFDGDSYWAGKIPTPPTTELVLTLGVGPARPRARARGAAPE